MRENLAYNPVPDKKENPEEVKYLDGANEPVFDYRIGKAEQTVSDDDYAAKSEVRLTRADFDERAIIARKIKIIPEPGDIFAQSLVGDADMETIVVDEALAQKPTPKPLTRADFSEEAIRRAKKEDIKVVPDESSYLDPHSPAYKEYHGSERIDPRLQVSKEDTFPMQQMPSRIPAGRETVTVADRGSEILKEKPLTREDFTDNGIMAAKIEAGTVSKTYYPPANAVPIKFTPAPSTPKKSFLKRLVPGFISRFFK